MLVTDHTKSTADLKTAAAAATPAIALPAVLPAELQTKLDALKAAKGAAFDTLFLEQQKEGHQKALDALNSYSSTGDVASLKTFAGKASPVVQRHLDELNGDHPLITAGRGGVVAPVSHHAGRVAAIRASGQRFSRTGVTTP